MVRWDPFPLEHQLGIIRGYRLFYDITEQRNVSQRGHHVYGPKELILDGVSTSAELQGLQIYTKYCVQMSAFTRIGDGPLSNCTHVVTDEDGTFYFYCFTRYLNQALVAVACAASELNPGIVRLRNSARILVLDPQRSSTIYILDLDWPLRVSVLSDLVIGQSTVIIMQPEDK